MSIPCRRGQSMKRKGVIATADGTHPIEALYFSTSGGFTANNEDVFNSNPVAYLRGIPDHQRGNSLENHEDGVQNNANARSLRAAREWRLRGRLEPVPSLDVRLESAPRFAT